ncbi:anti-sigma-K factor RskA [Nonomuraea thailandensis]|uniref:Regulator of SigK n=1 Tax=Nonomuraea thailandensis TaxID=1188745 RepID=A0A9X2K3K1_9ACTN|nr:anti-sigma factor [Nonomuraea thailandensis]MCP2359123.1 anti-sigma-K factor RskA [Nonomuraea thailandensis]
MKDELHTLSGAYAVHALPYAEWVLFEKHLHACGTCAAEVRQLRETAARLAETVAERPPSGLRRRLLDAASRSRGFEDPTQQPRDDGPTVWRRPPPAAPPAGEERQPATLSLPPERPGHRTGPQLPGTAGGGQVVPLRRRRSRTAAVLVAVSAAAATVSGVVAFDARRDLSDLTSRNEEMVAVLAAPDAETMREPVTTGGTATVVISRDMGRMVFTSSGLADLPGTKGYELWLMGPDGPRPAGLLDRRQDGVSHPMMLAPLDRDGHVALTVEPASGSERPTTQPVMLAELPEA